MTPTGPPAIYLDHLNGGPPLDAVVAAVIPWLGVAANPQADHGPGRRAQMALAQARQRVAGWLGASAAEMVFTGSGTEANNLAVKGYLRANRRRGRRIVVSAMEHASITQAVRRMTDDGWEIDTVPVDRWGRVDPSVVAAATTNDTALICLQLANPEVGTVQPVAAVAAVARDHRAALLVDAVAAAGRMPVDVQALGADLLTVSAAPMWGPAGAACLYVRRGVRVQPEIDGGVQEDGRRGGMENLAAWVGFGVAAETCAAHLPTRQAHLNRLAHRFRARTADIPDIRLTGPDPDTDPETNPTRLPGHVSLLVAGVEGQSLVLQLDAAGVAASTGSVCGAKAMKASPVLQALGESTADAVSGLVVTFGPDTTDTDVDQGATALRQCIRACRDAVTRPGSVDTR